MKKQKQTVAEKIRARNIKRPPAFLYFVLGNIWKLLFKKKYGIQTTFKTDFRKEKARTSLFLTTPQERIISLQAYPFCLIA
jgi:hypothetical protein